MFFKKNDKSDKKKYKEFIAVKKIKQGIKDDTFNSSEYEYKMDYPTTFKDKWRNYWYHYAFRTFIIILAVFLASWIIKDTFFPQKYDITIIVVSDIYLGKMEEEYVADLTLKLEEYVDDYNKDGQKNVLLDVIAFNDVSNNAAYTKLMAILTSGRDIIFITDINKYNHMNNIAKEQGVSVFKEISDTDRIPIEDTVLDKIVKDRDNNKLALSIIDVDYQNKSEKQIESYKNQLEFFYKITKTTSENLLD